MCLLKKVFEKSLIAGLGLTTLMKMMLLIVQSKTTIIHCKKYFEMQQQKHTLREESPLSLTNSILIFFQTEILGLRLG